MAAAAAALVLGCTHPGHGPDRPEHPDRPGGHGGKPLATYAGYKSEIYGDKSKWRCRPDTDDAVCDHNLDITVIKPDGSTEIEKRRPGTDSPIDCFYVYPTVSRDTTPNSDLIPGANEEDLAIRYQAAQIGTQCRLYAPLYRQVTLGAITPPPTTAPTTTAPTTTAPTTTAPTTTAPTTTAPTTTAPTMAATADPADATTTAPPTTAPPTTTPPTTTAPPTTVTPPATAGAVAYGDVLDAFKQYIANDNKGRGFVIMGHSQGTANLTQLLHSEIEPNPELRSHLVSALLIGGSPRLGAGENDIKACTDAHQLSCVVSFASYRAGTGPTGPLANPNATCTNPAALGGGKAVLHPVWNTSRLNPFRPSTPPPWATAGAATTITTDFVSTPGLVSGECVTGAASYFAITVNADPADPRTDDITGDLGGGNLHIMDVALTSGDLSDIVRTQARVYRSHHEH
jgi:hypothetical protein